MKKTLLILFGTLCCGLISAVGVYDVRNYGAKGDGQTLDSPAINAAIVVSNITMSHVHHYPIYITTGCRNRGPKDVTRLSSARDIQISNVIADDCDSLCSIIVTGMKDEPIRNVWLSNIRLYFKGGGTRDLVNKDYREQGTNYPEPKFAGWTPAYGLYARHVEGLHVSDVTFRYERPDYRPAVVLDDVRDVTLKDINSPTEEGIDQVVRF